MKNKLKKMLLLCFAVLMCPLLVKAENYSLELIDGFMDYDAAKEVITMVNEEREKQNLSPLVIDAELMEAAMLRARELVTYFHHTRPNGKDCFTVSEKAFGENIAAWQTYPEGVMDSWMNSDGHRANILNSSFKSIGVGCYVHNGQHYWVQLFSITSSTAMNTKNGKIADKNPKVEVSSDYLNELLVNYPSDNFYWAEPKITLYTGLKISPEYYSLRNSGWDRAYAKLTFSNFKFRSSDNSIFTVDEKGNLTPLKTGVAKLYITLGSLTQELEVTIKPRVPISYLDTDHSRVSIIKGNTYFMDVYAYPLNTTDSQVYTWKIEDESILSFDGCASSTNQCTFKGLKKGTTKVTATSVNGKSVSMTIEVIEESENRGSDMLIYLTSTNGGNLTNLRMNGDKSGEINSGKQIEQIEFWLQKGTSNYSGDLEFRAYVQSIGWESTWKKGYGTMGTKGKRLEAFQLRLTGEMAKNYDIYYRSYVQNLGWLDWAKNGTSSGTANYSYRIESIEAMLVKKGAPAPGKTTLPYRKKEVSVTYQTGVQQKGWLDKVSNGITSGTTGSGLRMEGLKVILENQEYTGNIEYRSHVQKQGWEKTWKKNGEISGTQGQALRLEAIQIRLTGEMAKYYDVYYRIHSQRFGWLDWAKNGASAGTAGFGFRVEAIQIKLVKKGSVAPGSTTRPYVSFDNTIVTYQTQVQKKGWLSNVSNGITSGTVGSGLRMEGLKINLKNQGFTGNVEYRTHIQKQGWETTWKKNGELSGTQGQALRLEALQLRLTGNMAKEYDIYYRVHAQKFGWLGWAKNGESAGTAGFGLRLEAIQIVLVRKGMTPPGSTENHYYSKS